MNDSKQHRSVRLGVDPTGANPAPRQSVAVAGDSKSAGNRLPERPAEGRSGKAMATGLSHITKMWRILSRLLGSVEDWLSSALLLSIVLVMFFAVARRYLLHSPVAYMNELVVLLSVWLACLGAASASRRGLHIRIDLLVDALPGRLRLAVRLITNLCLVFVLVVLTDLGVALATNSFQEFESLGISKGYMVAALPAAFGLMALHYLHAVYTDILQIVRKGGSHD
jgi:TRAP-type C4-dicarboxylate transport system permease small subunit